MPSPSRPRAPAAPSLPTSLELASVAEHDLEDETTFERLAFEVDLPGRVAEAVEFEECRFHGADLSGAILPRARLIDCLVAHTNMANLRAEKASMVRVRLADSRLTGLQWLDGTLRDVVVSQSRADLSVFRSSKFLHVRFEDCNLTGADFQNAELGGAEFVGCDLTGAQFTHATMVGTRFRDCELTGVGGVTSFRGASLAGQDLIALSYTLATALGIQITQDATEDVTEGGASTAG